MRRVDYNEYLEYVEKHRVIEIEDQRIELKPIKVSRLHPRDREEEFGVFDPTTTVWSFPKRGSWATHRGDYRGNWPPQMARLLIMKYTEPGDTVLDPMIGSGTTCIEAKLLGRNCIGVDINYDAVILTLHRLYWLEKALEESDQEGFEQARKARVEIYHGDARNLDKILDNSIDLVATHPPYLNIIKYSRRVEGDISKTRSLRDYLKSIRDIASEIMRVLKPGHYLGILVGDTRIRRHYVPITHYVLQVLLDTGFILKEEIVKIQHKMKTTREIWSRLRNRDFLLIYHEKLFILRKPSSVEEYRRYRYSSKQDFIELRI